MHIQRQGADHVHGRVYRAMHTDRDSAWPLHCQLLVLHLPLHHGSREPPWHVMACGVPTTLTHIPVARKTSLVPLWRGSFMLLWRCSFMSLWRGSFMPLWRGSFMSLWRGSFMSLARLIYASLAWLHCASPLPPSRPSRHVTHFCRDSLSLPHISRPPDTHYPRISRVSLS